MQYQKPFLIVIAKKPVKIKSWWNQQNTFYRENYLEITKGSGSIQVQVQYIFIYTIDNFVTLYVNHVQLCMTVRFVSTVTL